MNPTKEPVVKSNSGPDMYLTIWVCCESSKKPDVNPTKEPDVNLTKEPDVNPTKEPVMNSTSEPDVNPTNWVCCESNQRAWYESNQLSLLWIQPRSLL